MAPQNEKFYAVYSVYSSWAQVHPRVTQCDGAVHKTCNSYEEACKFTEIEEDPKHAADEKATTLSRGAYYAVVYGRSTGIFNNWKDVVEAVDGFTSACHQCFSTEQKAKEFIEDWKDAYADIWRREIRQDFIPH